MALELRNPHSVLAALEKRPHDVVEIRCSSRNPTDAWREVITLAAKSRTPVRSAINKASQGGRRSSRHNQAETERSGASVAIVKERDGVSLQELFSLDEEVNKDQQLWLAFDHLNDTHNVGALLRTAGFFGVRGVIITTARSAPLSATVYDIAAGGMEYVPFSLASNLARAIDVAKEAGLWILGSSEHAETDIADVPRDRPWLLVLGNEQNGLRQLTLKKCDEVCRLSPRGGVTSLNVSVAGGVLISTLTGVG